jgi:hypothetical protein
MHQGQALPEAATFGPIEVTGDHGWVELQLIGALAAVDAAHRLAELSGVTAETEREEYTPGRPDITAASSLGQRLSRRFGV